MSAPRLKAEAGQPSAIELVEEAVQLLRRAPVQTLAIYYAGAVPFALGFLYFWAHATWFLPARESIAWSALGLAGLYVGLKAAQAEFCARLFAQCLRAEPPVLSWRRVRRTALAQGRLQPWALLALIPAALTVVPLAWVYAYGQSLSVGGGEEGVRAEAAALARLWPAQNLLGLGFLLVLFICAWINLGVAFWAVPWVANHLFGVDNLFGLGGWKLLNSTAVASITLITWLALDPLIKSFYTLRLFYGRARRTGEDLRVGLRAARMGAAAALVAIGFGFSGGGVTPARAAEAPPAARTDPAQLRRAIAEVLNRPDFQWRLPPAPAEAAEKDGPVERFFRQGADWVANAWHTVWGWAEDWYRWLFPPTSSAESSGGWAASVSVLRIVIYFFIAAAVVLIGVVIFQVWRDSGRTVTAAIPVPAVAAAPDLNDESSHAGQLPPTGWLGLARSLAGRGEWRLALRAAYLATLAQLAEDRLLSLARHKTNLDYERELRRSALSRADLVEEFAGRRRTFESVWYGRAAPAEAQIREWLAQLERLPHP